MRIDFYFVGTTVSLLFLIFSLTTFTTFLPFELDIKQDRKPQRGCAKSFRSRDSRHSWICKETLYKKKRGLREVYLMAIPMFSLKCWKPSINFYWIIVRRIHLWETRLSNRKKSTDIDIWGITNELSGQPCYHPADKTITRWTICYSLSSKKILVLHSWRGLLSSRIKIQTSRT